MAKKSLIEREKKRKNMFLKNLSSRIELKKTLKKTISFEEKLSCLLKLQDLPRNSSPSRLVCFNLLKIHFIFFISFQLKIFGKMRVFNFSY